MNNYENYLSIINTQDKENKNNLFLHVCCGPCSTSVLRLLIEYFNIFIIFNNPNIDTIDEYNKRFEQVLKVIEINKYNIKVLEHNYNHDEYLQFIKGLENEPEGGKRCAKCFELRLKNSFDISSKYIIENNILDRTNYLTTTLTVSPHKNEILINSIAFELSKNYQNIVYLPSNYKKNDGYLNSIKLSKEYGLYRQEYCGCEFA